MKEDDSRPGPTHLSDKVSDEELQSSQCSKGRKKSPCLQ
jgi:hypothetical protein